MYLVKSLVSEPLKNGEKEVTFRPGDDCVHLVCVLSQCNDLVDACLSALVSVCRERIAEDICNFAALLRCCVEDNYLTEIFKFIVTHDSGLSDCVTSAWKLFKATHDSDLGVVYWGYCGISAWDQDVL